MTTQELQAELANIKVMLTQLQSTVDHLTTLLEASQPQPDNQDPQIGWLALTGVGKEVWHSVDIDAYIDAERNAWN
jgi:hypothetical protein